MDTLRRTPLLLLAFCAASCASSCGGRGATDASAIVRASRGTVVRKAIATGFVEALRESQVNTQLAGFVRNVRVKLGDKVKAGQALLEVWPLLTEQDLLRAERSLQAAVESEEAAQEFVEGQHLLAGFMRLLQGKPQIDRMKRSAERGRRNAEETLELLRSGSVESGGRKIDFVVRAPVAGTVLEIHRVGDPVTPRSNFGTGTFVAVIGDLDRPVFRGTVDEIDVGRLREGMTARVRLGALPDVELVGKVLEIGLRARREDGAARFDVRVALEQPTGDVKLRAGFSAVAEVELARAADVVVLPERVLRFDDGKAWVHARTENGERTRRDLELGVGDGLLVEVRAGLAEGDAVFESNGGTPR